MYIHTIIIDDDDDEDSFLIMCHSVQCNNVLYCEFGIHHADETQ